MADKIFQDPNQLCKRSLTALAMCGDLSCDNSIVEYCKEVWQIKSVEVPNPSLNPGKRVKSHSYLQLQSSSIDRGDESYHSSMFKLEENSHEKEGLSQGNSKTSMDKFDQIKKMNQIKPQQYNSFSDKDI